MNERKNNGKMTNEEIIETVVAIEEGKKKGLTPFEVGVLMGVRNIALKKSKNDKKKK